MICSGISPVRETPHSLGTICSSARSLAQWRNPPSCSGGICCASFSARCLFSCGSASRAEPGPFPAGSLRQGHTAGPRRTTAPGSPSAVTRPGRRGAGRDGVRGERRTERGPAAPARVSLRPGSMRPPGDHGIQDQVSALRSSPAPLQALGRETGTDFPALPPLRVRPRGRDPGRARGPRVRQGEGEGRGENARCPAGRRDGQDGPSEPNSGRDPGGTLRPCPRRGGRADPASTHPAARPALRAGRGGQCNVIGAGLREGGGAMLGTSSLPTPPTPVRGCGGIEGVPISSPRFESSDRRATVWTGDRQSALAKGFGGRKKSDASD